MTNYEKIKIEVIRFEQDDVIKTSGNENNDNIVGEGDFWE